MSVQTPSASSSNYPWVTVREALSRLDRHSRDPKSFLILGAGIAGIAAAYELQRRGHRVRILEGSERVGGRIYTHRFDDGTRAERGAMRIPEAHDYSYHYIAEAGLRSSDLRRFFNSNPQGLDFMDVHGTVARSRDFGQRILPHFPGLNDREKAAISQRGPGGVLLLYLEPLMDRLRANHFALGRRLLDGDFSHPQLAQWDARSMRDYLAEHASEDGFELMARVLTLKPNWDWSLAILLRNELHQPGPKLCELKGGMDRLISGLVPKLQEGTIECRQEVVAIEARSDGGSVLLKDRTRIPFERCLCTFPFPVMRSMSLPGFSAGKIQAIRGMRYCSASKVYLSYKERWWESRFQIRAGRSISDRPDGNVFLPHQAYYPSDGADVPCVSSARREAVADYSDGLFNEWIGDPPEPDLAMAPRAEQDLSRPGSILASYTFDESARRLCRLPADERAPAVAESLEPIHGPVASSYAHEDAWCWDEYPWAKGALAMTLPGDMSRHLSHAKQPEGRVYFAGEHVSMAPGWIQGSIESALREIGTMLRDTD